MREKLRIVFMGTPEFAVASLNALITSGFMVVGVVTAPDKPAGRGKKITESPVKIFASKNDLKILQPANLKSPDFIDELRALNANLGIVVAFRMLPEIVWEMPEYGTFNLHASLLPDYRGAAPINHAVMNGETETGVTTFFLKHEIDTGHIIFQQRTPIYPGETAGELHDRLMAIGAKLVVKTTRAIQIGDYPEINQGSVLLSDSNLKQAPKIFKDDCRIIWTNSLDEIHNFVRGLCPHPAAFCFFVNEDKVRFQVKIFKVRPQLYDHNHQTGDFEISGKEQLAVWVKNGKIIIEELQMEGKKRIQIKDFLNGISITERWKIE